MTGLTHEAQTFLWLAGFILLQTVDRFVLEESVRIELKPVVISCPVPLSLSSENCSADAANVVLSAQVGKAIVPIKTPVLSPGPMSNGIYMLILIISKRMCFAQTYV